MPAPQLAQSPKEIVHQKRQELAREIQWLERPPRWLRRLPVWRQTELFVRQDGDRGFLIISLVFWSVLNILLAMIAFQKQGERAVGIVSWSIIYGFSALYSFIITKARHFSQDKRRMCERRMARRHLLVSIIPPLMLMMPFIRIFDLVITSQWGMKKFAEQESLLIAKRQELADLKASTLVPTTYRTAIELARKQFLGDSSELRVTEKDLAKRLETIRSQIERLDVRLREASGDPDREPLLQRTLARMHWEQESLERALEAVRLTMAKTRALLDEFALKIAKMSKPFEDAELVLTFEQGEKANAEAIQSAYETVDRHRKTMCASFLALATAVSEHPALPQGDGDSLEEYLLQADAIGLRLAAFESRDGTS